jgi:restriction endonuclease Mrr
MPVVSLLERLFDYLCFTQLSAWSPNEAWFVTTSFFTDQAADEVSDLTHLRRMVLVDGQKLVNFIHQH